MELYLASLLLYAAGAAIIAGLKNNSSALNRFGVIAALLGSTAGILAVILTREPVIHWQIAWSWPFTTVALCVDPLSRFFLFLFYVVLIPMSIYACSFTQQGFSSSTKSFWICLLTLMAGMVLTLLADSLLLFIIAWELMSLAAFFLVIHEDKHEVNRQAGLVYLIASHIGTAFLFILFWLLTPHTALLSQPAALPATLKNIAILFAMIGFGVKAGLVPLHIWLPEAHPAAPSPVSALMSGLVIKTGLYGILRFLTLLLPVPDWTGKALLIMGAITALTGILFAAMERDVKKLLAFSSIENMGIIFIGFGLGFIAWSQAWAMVAVMAWLGGFLHIINHAITKSLLFTSIGTIYSRTHTRDLEKLGGLLKVMPFAGNAFLFASLALAGLPPLNAFLGELLIYIAGFGAVGVASKGFTFWPLLAVLTLTIAGGLAFLTYSKAFGIAFLGEPRANHSTVEKAETRLEKTSIILLLVCAGAVCAVAGIALPLLAPLLMQISGQTQIVSAAGLKNAQVILTYVAMATAGLMLIALVLLWLRRLLTRHKSMAREATWDCGYTWPSPRMQYTAGSFSQPLTDALGDLGIVDHQQQRPEGLLPEQATFSQQVSEPVLYKLFLPLFRKADGLLAKLQWMQNGRLHIYILYIAATLLLLLLWYGVRS
jgi:formate hydrogenlyase subunit 3/multisubunit Na+/H+ antiporter MnhD subunit